MKYDTDTYNKIFFKLPSEIQDVIAASETTNKIYRLGNNHFLHIDQIAIVHNVIQDVMMGIVASRDFNKELARELGINPSKIATLIKDIDDQIFKPIKDIMLRAYADGSPNRLRTIETADEHDTEHENLSKQEILHEIENPAKTESKKWVASEQVTGDRLQVTVENKKTREDDKERNIVTDKKEILAPKSPVGLPLGEIEAPKPPEIKTPEDAKTRLLRSIESAKLQNIVTMKKTVETISPATTPINRSENKVTPPPVIEIASKQAIKDPFKITPTPVESAIKKPEVKAEEKKKIIDPYRENIT